MFPKFNIQYTDSGGVLLCPSCNTDYLHQGRVNFFYPAQECHVMVDAPLVQVDQSMEGNPSIERQGLTERGGHQSSLPREAGGKLNPEFVCFLMGVPQGWTSLDPLPAESYQRWLSEPHWEDGEWEGVPRVTDKTKDRVNRLKALGNGIVPACVARFLSA